MNKEILKSAAAEARRHNANNPDMCPSKYITRMAAVYIETWYDRQSRQWIAQIKDNCHGYQQGAAEFGAGPGAAAAVHDTACRRAALECAVKARGLVRKAGAIVQAPAASRDPLLPADIVAILKDCSLALNMCPDCIINKETGRRSYDTAAALDKIIRQYGI